MSKQKITKEISEICKNLVIVLRKENKKMDMLIEILKEKKILDVKDLQILSKIAVFPRIEVKS